jgi:hypothetical protein
MRTVTEIHALTKCLIYNLTPNEGSTTPQNAEFDMRTKSSPFMTYPQPMFQPERAITRNCSSLSLASIVIGTDKRSI